MKNSGQRVFPWWIAVFSLLISCAGPAPKPKLDIDAAQVSQLCQQGDAEFAKMHWRGWKNAAGYYQEALAKQDEPELRQRLFGVYILLSLRESELLFNNESWLQQAKELLPRLPALPFTSYLALACEKARYISLNRGHHTGYWSPELKKNPVPREAAAAQSHYLYLLYLGLVIGRDEGQKLIDEGNEFRRLHGDSNLKIFLRNWTPEEMDEKLATFPDFAEMYKLRGDWHNSGKKYQAALADYQHALEAMPVLFKASNAMGNLCYSIEEYEQALLHYGKTLEIDPLEPAALFGRAICLSQLERYDESDRALNEIIEKQSFYHGEANYYLAKNNYYRRRLEKTRMHLERAAAYIPDSPEMNMLSGLLYLDRGQPGPAAFDFRKVLEQQPQHVEAWYFLGQAVLQEKKIREARSHFQSAIENFRRELGEFDAKLAAMRSEEGTDPYRRNYFLKRQRQRSAYVREAIERLAPLQNTFRRPPLPGLKKLLVDLAAPSPGK